MRADGRGRILVHDVDGALAGRVRAAVGADGPEVVESTDARSLSDRLGGQPFDLLVAGSSLATRAGFERLRIIREELPQMALVLVVSGADRLDVRSVVRTGAMDLVDADDPGPVLASALAAGLATGRRLRSVGDHVALVPPPGRARGARVLTVTSASEGVGATFLATNAAWFLQHHGGRRVCIIDLDLQAGEVARTLHHQPRATVTGLRSLGEDELRQQMAAVCETHVPGISVLAAPGDAAEARAVQVEDVARLVRVARDLYDEVVIDTPPRLTDAVVAALHETDELIVVGTLEVAPVRDMRALLTTLDDHDLGGDLLLVLNRVERDAVAVAHRILEMFPQGPGAVLPDGREVARATASGRVVLDRSPGARISIQLGAALRRYLEPEARERFDASQGGAPTGRPLLRRLIGETA